ncbi:MAG: type II toxin-antitoxin system prevent-host-death family antitoxin [Gemmatimonadetes bacterium]|nr:type II toxin-antitoxin system prevent-host-death family antitoxin [Gemmatimonadota bacterium]
MKAVGVKDLKARLSEYLRYVKAGEAVLVTDRGEVVAELRPVAGTYAAPGPDLEIDTLVSDGEVSPPLLARVGGRWWPGGFGLPAGTAARLLAELREDR